MIEIAKIVAPFAAGFLACWFTKDWLIRAYDGDTNFIRRSREKIDRLEARLFVTRNRNRDRPL